MRLRFPTGPQVRFGYALEKSPQPDITVGAFLPDADRTTLTAGFGLDWLDVAVGYTTYKQRVVQTNIQQFNGNYRAKSWVAMLTVTK
jgi:long-subunit fatty acid transport protein